MTREQKRDILKQIPKNFYQNQTKGGGEFSMSEGFEINYGGEIKYALAVPISMKNYYLEEQFDTNIMIIFHIFSKEKLILAK